MRFVWKLVRPLRRPVLRALFRIAPPEANHWEEIKLHIPYYVFGRGSIRRFSWYFEGESHVPAGSVDAICEWLQACEYVRDPDLFHETDYWQHPKTFEQLRRGDCEDHALWAWRKLVELKLDAHLFVGNWRQHEATEPGGHVWVVFTNGTGQYLMETVAKSAEGMVRPLGDVRDEYSPHFSVDPWYQTRGYVGYLHELKREVGLSGADKGA